jgi:hypothetical protein
MAKKPVSDQMELFEDGGLKDQGKTKDPVSNNPVPIGSTQEEVRDDIPAQLSEGEFVLPADVVRYHGLEKIMGIRDQAKQGLQKMEQMGQMGNSDQATIPDGVPFKQMAEGGVVPGVNIQGPTTQLTKPSMFATPAQTQPQQVAQPVTVQTPKAPVYTSSQVMPKVPYTFEQAIGTPFGQQQQSETRVYINDAGEKLYIPFVNGQSIYPIPAGYKPEPVAEKEKEQEQTVTDVRARSATTQDTGDDSVGIKSTAVSDLAKAAQRREAGVGKGLATAVGALINPIAAIGGTIISSLTGRDKPETLTPAEALDEERAFEGITPQEVLEENSQRAFDTDIRNATAMFGATPTFKFGKEAGDVDKLSNGVYHASGLAMNSNGSASLTKDGTVSYKSFDDFINHLAASHDTGWHGSTVSKEEYESLGQKGKDRYDAWASQLGYKTGGGTKFADPKDDRLTKVGDEIKGGDQKPTTTISKPFGKDADRFRGSTPPSSTKYTGAFPTPRPSVSTKGDSRVSTPLGKVDQFLELSPAVQRELKVGLARDPSLLKDPFENMSPNKLASLKKAAKKTQDIYDDMYKGRKGAGISNIVSQEYLDRNEEAAQRGGDYGVGSSLYSDFGTVTPSYDDNNSSDDDGGQSSGGGSASSDMGFSTASGGFIQRKNLPKANKKKRGGLASRQ